MKIVLRADIDGVGKRGDVVEVSDGHAAELPSSLGPGDRRDAATSRRRQPRCAGLRDVADSKPVRPPRRWRNNSFRSSSRSTRDAGKAGRLFGSVTPAEIVAAVEAQTSVVLDRHKLIIHEPIKSVGTHEVGVHLHPEVEFALTVEVVS